VPGEVRSSIAGGRLVLIAQGQRLRAILTLHGRHRCLGITDEEIRPLRQPEEPKAVCTIEEVP